MNTATEKRQKKLYGIFPMISKKLLASFPGKEKIIDFFLFSLPQISGLLCSFIGVVLWTNLIDPSIYGQYNVIVSILNTLACVCLSGLGISMNISAAHAKFGNYLKIIKYRIACSIVGSIIICVIPFVPAFKMASLKYPLLLVALLFPVWNLSLAKDWLTGEKRFKIVAGIEILVDIISLSLMFIFVFMLRLKTLTVLLLILMGLQTIVNTLITLHVWQYIIKPSKEKRNDEKIIHYGIHQTFASLLSIALPMQNIFLAQFLTFPQLAIFVVARLFPDQIKLVFGIVSRMFFPYLASFNDLKSLWDWVKYRFVFLTIFFFCIGILGYFAISYLVPYLFSAKYGTAAQYGKWMFLTLAMLAPCSLFNIILQTRIHYTRYLYVSMFFASLVSIGSLFMFVPKFGLWGGVYAYISYILFQSTFFTLSFIHYYNKEQRAANAAVCH